MKNFIVIFVSALFLSSCDKDPKNDQVVVSIQDIVGTWKQAVPTILKVTDSLTGITEDWVFEETYFLGTDNRFSISGKTYLKIGNQGSYAFDPSIPEIDFRCEGAYVEIGGIPVQLEKEPQRWKWEIYDFKDDTLIVNIKQYDKSTNTFEDIKSIQKYIKQ